MKHVEPERGAIKTWDSSDKTPWCVKPSMGVNSKPFPVFLFGVHVPSKTRPGRPRKKNTAERTRMASRNKWAFCFGGRCLLLQVGEMWYNPQSLTITIKMAEISQDITDFQWEVHYFNQLMVKWVLWRVGGLDSWHSPYERECCFGAFESQTAGPQTTNLSLVDDIDLEQNDVLKRKGPCLPMAGQPTPPKYPTQK